jgi:predicted DNA-binding transcriptional regulator AlpA
MDESDYLTLNQASRLLGVSRWTIYRRIDELNIPVFTSQSNRRVKLVRRSEIEALRQPRLLESPLGTPLADDNEGANDPR